MLKEIFLMFKNKNFPLEQILKNRKLVVPLFNLKTDFGSIWAYSNGSKVLEYFCFLWCWGLNPGPCICWQSLPVSYFPDVLGLALISVLPSVAHIEKTIHTKASLFLKGKLEGEKNSKVMYLCEAEETRWVLKIQYNYLENHFSNQKKIYLSEREIVFSL